MDAKQNSGPHPVDKEFMITRILNAPREIVFKAWTEPDRLAQWFGPKGCKVRIAAADLRPGGTFLYAMRMPDGKEMWGKWVFREIIFPEKLILVNSFSDEKGGFIRHPMSASWPLEMLSTTTFTEEAGKTKLTLRWIPINASEAERKTFDGGRDGMIMGWTGTFEQLDAYLASLK